MVGKSYPPEFYSWIKNPKTRSVFERIAQETEEDYQSLIKILKKFNVEVLRPEIPDDFSLLFDKLHNNYAKPPMSPRDYFGMYENIFTIDTQLNPYQQFYNNVKDPSWPIVSLHTLNDFNVLPNNILNELNTKFALSDIIDVNIPKFNNAYNDVFYSGMVKYIEKNASIVEVHETSLATATVSRIGKDIYLGGSDIINTNTKTRHDIVSNILQDKYRIHTIDVVGHVDGYFCPVVPGLIISIYDIKTYKDTFPGWEVVYLPDQSWEKVKPFMELKKKNQGKWWIPGEEYNDDVIEVVDAWMSKWVGYVEETVFDVNMLVIDEKNVVVNNYNKQVFDAFDRYGITPHICNFRHRYFWDGGLHCITSDLDREGEMKDYFPDRG